MFAIITCILLKDFCFKCIPLCVLSILLLLLVLHYHNKRQTIVLHATFERLQPLALFMIMHWLHPMLSCLCHVM